MATFEGLRQIAAGGRRSREQHNNIALATQLAALIAKERPKLSEYASAKDIAHALGLLDGRADGA